MNNQVSMVRVDLATDVKELAARFKAIHASSEAAKAVVRELKPVLLRSEAYHHDSTPGGETGRR